MKSGNKLFTSALVLACVLVALAAGVVYATEVSVDTFNDVAMSVCSPVDYLDCFLSERVVSAPVLGSYRSVVVSHTSGNGYVRSYVDLMNSNQFSFNQDSGVMGSGQIIWDGDNVVANLNRTGLGGVDLTDGGNNDGFQIIVVRADQEFDLTIKVYNAVNELHYTLSLPGQVLDPGQSFFVPFSAFTVVSGARDFTSVGAVEFDIESTADSVDLTLDLFEAEAQRDYGDLPAAYNLTLNADGGAYHVVGDLWLGTTVDVESDGVESATAVGDDQADLDDENGIIQADTDTSDFSGWMNGTNGGGVYATVHGSGSACLSGWMDWNADGDFGDAGEHILDGHGVNPGTSLVTFDVPTNFFGAPGVRTVNARFRLYPETTGLCGPMAVGGVATNGEVEDYQWNFDRPTAVTLSSVSVSADSNSALIVVIAALGVLGIGLTAAVVLGQRRKARSS